MSSSTKEQQQMDHYFKFRFALVYFKNETKYINKTKKKLQTFGR